MVEVLGLLVVNTVCIGLGDYIFSCIRVKRVADTGQWGVLSPFWWDLRELLKHVLALRAAPAGFFIEKWNNHIDHRSWMPFMSHAIWNAERKLWIATSYWVWSVHHLRLELDLESTRHFPDMPGHTIVALLRLVWQAIQTVVRSGLEICVDRLNAS